jgi:membrane-bound lytic murein transglycosylase A
MRLAKWRPLAGAVVVLGLAGCGEIRQHVAFLEPKAAAPAATTWSVPPGPGPAMTPIRFDQVVGWSSDRQADALATFLTSCTQLTAAPDQVLGGQGEAASRGGVGADWQPACAAAQSVVAGDDAAARRFFETWFQPYGVSADGSSQGLFTGYFEPEVAGSRTPGGVYRYPLLRRPADLGNGQQPYYTRAEIEHGALRNRHLELLWLADPIDVFFLHVQGAGRVRLPDGEIVRVTYDGQNGRTYVPIGRVLAERGEMTLDQVSMQSIRAWLVAHPDQAAGVMDANPSYVFFREVPGARSDQGPPSTLGVPLSPGRSIAVDKAFIPLGAPVWIDTTDPVDGAKLRRLMMAQDLGGAIRGPVRADIFFGWGNDAEERAGRMREPGVEVLLLPKGINPTALR